MASFGIMWSLKQQGALLLGIQKNEGKSSQLFLHEIKFSVVLYELFSVVFTHKTYFIYVL